MNEASAVRGESVEEFQSQLAWREFYAHVLREHPNVVTRELHGCRGRHARWRPDDEELVLASEGP